MGKIVCEMCGNTDLVKQDGVYVCQFCGTKYTPEEAKKMMIEGTVDVKGTVQVDNSTYVQKYLQNARRALNKEDWEEVEKYYNMVEQNVSDSIEAVFFSSYGKAADSFTNSDFYKREHNFVVLAKSMSVISDYYETTSENKEEILAEIGRYVRKLSAVTYVYNPNAFGGQVGGYTWNERLIKSIQRAFYIELTEIAEKHDDLFIKELLEKYADFKPAEVKMPERNINKIIIVGIVLCFVFPLVGLIVLLIGVSKNKKKA